LSRIFNNATIIIDKEVIVGYTEVFTIIGYSIKLMNRYGQYTLRFVGDKLEVLRILNSYLLLH
jgi:hypothetical protein